MDKEFLSKLDRSNSKERYARITSLTIDEHPVEQIEGRITQGSVNIDGASAVRRTCSLTLVAQDLNIHDFNWGLKTKFTLEVGVKNNIDSKYPKIIWFPLGTYVISSFSISEGINNFNISIQGKDKMCMVNGELGGIITALTHDFGKYTEIVKDEKGKESYVIRDFLIKDIIKSVLHELCFEPLHNIVINDLDEYGVELLEYRGDEPMYLLRKEGSDREFTNLTFNADNETWEYNGQVVSLKALEEIEDFKFDNLSELNNENPSAISYNGRNYYVAKVTYGQTTGYRNTDLVYAGELILNVGESGATVLDKLVKMLGDFEYFYDLQGRFIFQRKKIYQNKSWNSLIDENGDIYAENANNVSPISYSFDDELLIQSISCNPQVAQVKNDYSIWGTRKSVTGAEVPVHLRYAIDTKPIYYKSYTGVEYKDIEWREILYQMAMDYRKYHDQDDFEIVLANNNFNYYPTGKTGYEQYYTDMEGFWRQIFFWEHDGESQPLKERSISYSSLKGDESNILVQSLIPTDKSKTYKRKDLYLIEDGYLYNVCERENYTLTDYYIREEKIKADGSEKEIVYTNLIKTIDISEYNLYKDQSTLYFDTLSQENQEKIYIQSGGRYYPVWDYESIQYENIAANILSNNNQSLFYKDSGKYYVYPSEIFYRDSSESKIILKNIQAIKNNINEILYYTNANGEEIKIQDKNNIYFYYKKDIINKKLYIDSQGIKISLSSSLSIDIIKTLLLCPFKESKFLNIYDLIKISKYSLYYKQNNNYYHYSEEEVIPLDNSYILSEEHLNISEMEDIHLKALYYKDNKFQKTIKMPKTNWKGQPTDLFLEFTEKINYFYETYKEFYEDGELVGWHKNVQEDPASLNFWIDFLDTDGELAQFSVKTIGDRAKAVNDKDVKSIYFQETPTILFSEDISSIDKQLGYTYVQLPKHLNSLFNLSSQGKSAFDALTNLLYNNAYRQESISISAIPIYYLEPNTRIYIRNEKNKIDGEYIVNKITLPLTYNGMMNISANRAISKIY